MNERAKHGFTVAFVCAWNIMAFGMDGNIFMISARYILMTGKRHNIPLRIH